MTPVDIRLARPDDRPQLLELMRRAAVAGESGAVRDRLVSESELIDIDAELIAGDQVFVAEIAGTIVGFASIATHEGDDAAIEDMFVGPAWWRRGIGTALLQALEREAVAWGANRLHVTASPGALSFYAANGFETVGEQRTELGRVVPLLAKPVGLR